jgi:hypothetical protein
MDHEDGRRTDMIRLSEAVLSYKADGVVNLSPPSY